METENALVLNQNRELTPAVWGMLKEIAPVMHISRLFGVASEHQAAAIMLKGYELGLGVTASFEFIQVIEGKPNLSPRGALALIQSKGILDEFAVVDLKDKAGAYFGAECRMKRGKVDYTARFTLEDAKKAQLTEGSPSGSGKRGYGNWEKYTRNMCTWRAIGFAADVVCPDVTGGLTTYLKMPEAFSSIAVSETGDFVKPEVIGVQEPQPAKALPTVSIADLASLYSPEKILAANNGMIPKNYDEVAAIAEKLAAASGDITGGLYVPVQE